MVNSSLEELMFAGMDIGSLVTKVVLMRDGEMASYSIVDSRADPRRAAERALEQALQDVSCNRNEIRAIVATGYGRVAVAFANKTVTELTCHARGAHHLDPSARTVIDIGGQDSKVIRVDETGIMVDFAMNDKCAAGTGRFLEVMAQALEVKIEDMGEFSLRAERPCPMSNTCTVFAETEVISLVASGAKKEDITAGIHNAIAARVGNMAMKLGLEEDVLLVGGVSKNLGVRRAVEAFLEVEFAPVACDGQIVGALGAALLARDLAEGRS